VTRDQDAPLRSSLDGGVLTVQLNRPAALNALTFELGERLVEALDRAEESDVRCVLLTGAGRAFSAGADLKAFGAGERPDLGAALRTLFNHPVRQIRDLEKPVVAVVNGPAVGIGVSYAMACDVVIAARSAYFLLPFTGIGLVPDGGASCLITARAGWGRFSALAMTRRRLPAEEAQTWGLVDILCDADELANETFSLCARMAEGATSAFAATKRLVNEGALVGLDQALELEASLQSERARSEEFGEALVAFGTAGQSA
jgi:2-(1,2-epoxy-1,2-dihydrophenyl)acetyl-CoA isomerase